jgi:hypothetical protein
MYIPFFFLFSIKYLDLIVLLALESKLFFIYIKALVGRCFFLSLFYTTLFLTSFILMLNHF